MSWQRSARVALVDGSLSALLKRWSTKPLSVPASVMPTLRTWDRSHDRRRGRGWGTGHKKNKMKRLERRQNTHEAAGRERAGFGDADLEDLW